MSLLFFIKLITGGVRLLGINIHFVFSIKLNKINSTEVRQESYSIINVNYIDTTIILNNVCVR